MDFNILSQTSIITISFWYFYFPIILGLVISFSLLFLFIKQKKIIKIIILPFIAFISIIISFALSYKNLNVIGYTYTIQLDENKEINEIDDKYKVLETLDEENKIYLIEERIKDNEE